MDPTTERILEKTRHRRLQLEKELKSSINSEMTSNVSTPICSQFSNDGEDVSATAYGFDDENGFNSKKRKPTDAQQLDNNNISGNADIPSSKLSFAETSLQTGLDMTETPAKAPRCFYPLDELEALAKETNNQASEAISVSAAPPISNESGGFKSVFAELAAKIDEFEVENRPRKHVAFGTVRQNSPNRRESPGLALGTQSPILNRGRAGDLAPSKARDGATVDSGIESFYRVKSSEDVKERRNGQGFAEDGENSIIPPAPPLPQEAANLAMSVSPRAPGRNQPHRLGGLAQLLVADCGSPSPVKVTSTKINRIQTAETGKVASIASKLDNQTRTAAKEATPKVFVLPSKPARKLAVTTTSRERDASTVLAASSGDRYSGKSSITAPMKSVISSGVDTRPRPAVSKLLNRWEKATQEGSPLNPDDSVTDGDALASTAMKMLKPCANIQRRPYVARHKPQEAPIKTIAPLTDGPSIVSKKEIIVQPPTAPTVTVDACSSPTMTEDLQVDRVEECIKPSDEESPNSSGLSDYLNDAISYAQAAANTPPKLVDAHIPASTSSSKETAVARRLQDQIDVSPLPLVHTVSIYRKLEKNKRCDEGPLSILVKPPSSPDYQQLEMPRMRDLKGKRDNSDAARRQNAPAKLTGAEYEKRMKMLQDLILVQKEHISQLSRALYLCQSSSEFPGSRHAELDAHQALLIATELHRCLSAERNRLEECYRNRKPYVPLPPLGSLTLNRITLPLRRDFFNFQPEEIYYFLCILKHRDTLKVTQMVASDEALQLGELTFNDYIQFHGLPPDFEVMLEVYALKMHRDDLTHGDKHRSGKLATFARQLPGHTLFKHSTTNTTSLGGPAAVMDTKFKLAGQVAITLTSVSRRKFPLQEVRFDCPIEGSIYLELRCESEFIGTETERGFLHYFEEVGGRAAWERLWCVLDGHMLKFWKYPEDELENKPMLASIDMKYCVSDCVGPAPKQITSRPNAFAFETADGNLNILSADLKDESAVWCDKLNLLLRNMRMFTINGR